MAFAFNLRFPRQYYDAETEKNYNYFRDYDPSIGRYVQSDPIGLEGGINTFGYVGGRPMTVIDPTGLDNPGMGPYLLQQRILTCSPFFEEIAVSLKECFEGPTVLTSPRA